MTREQAIAKIMAVWPAQQLSTGRDVLAARLVDALVELDVIALDTADSRFGTITDIFEEPANYITKRDRS